MDKAIPGSVLQKFGLFRGLPEADVAVFLSVFQRRPLRPGEILWRQLLPGDSLALVASGRLAQKVLRSEGAVSTTEIAAGEVIDEMSCVDPAPRAATLVATEDALVLELDRAALLSLRQNNPALLVMVMGNLIDRITSRLRDTNTSIDRALRQRLARGLNSAPVRRVTRRRDPQPPQPLRGPVDLSRMKCLDGLTRSDIELLLSVAAPTRYPDGAALCCEGAPASTCFLIVGGAVQITRNFDGIERVLSLQGEGALVGQMALVTRTLRSATVRAQGEAIVLPIGRDEFEKLLRARSPLGIRFQEQVAIAGIRQLRSAAVRLAALLAPAPSAMSHTSRSLSYIQTALREWGIDQGQMDQVSTESASGALSPEEIRARQRH